MSSALSRSAFSSGPPPCIGQRRAREADILRRDGQRSNRRRQPHRLGRPVQRDLVQPATVDDHRPLDAQRGEHRRHRLEQAFLGDAEQLNGRLRRDHAGAEHVHDRPDAERAPHRSGMFQAGMVIGREQEAEADLVKRAPRRLRPRRRA